MAGSMLGDMALFILMKILGDIIFPYSEIGN